MATAGTAGALTASPPGWRQRLRQQDAAVVGVADGAVAAVGYTAVYTSVAVAAAVDIVADVVVVVVIVVVVVVVVVVAAAVDDVVVVVVAAAVDDDDVVVVVVGVSVDAVVAVYDTRDSVADNGAAVVAF